MPRIRARHVRATLIARIGNVSSSVVKSSALDSTCIDLTHCKAKPIAHVGRARRCAAGARAQQDPDPARGDGTARQFERYVTTVAAPYCSVGECAPSSVICVVIRTSGLFASPVLHVVARRVRRSPHYPHRVDRFLVLEIDDRPLRMARAWLVSVARIQIWIALPE